jgi:hypothetical protein
MILCPNCQHQETTGAIFCSKCGAPLVSDEIVTHNIATEDLDLPINSPIISHEVDETHASSWISLQILDSGQILPLADRKEFTLGRVSEGQPIMPDVDLTPYKAYENGVSRLHVVIKQMDKGIAIMDLGSSNGTFINGARVRANEDHLLSHGDVISLGKLKIQVLLRTKD